MYWVNDYINKPWRAYARGTDAYDCWGLVIHVLGHHFNTFTHQHSSVITDDSEGITTAFYEELSSGQWKAIDTPEHGSVVVCWQSGKVRHVGVYLAIDGGLILHSKENKGVTTDRLPAFQQVFSKVQFYVKDSAHYRAA